MRKLDTSDTTRLGRSGRATRITLALLVAGIALGGATEVSTTAAATAIAPAPATSASASGQDSMAQPFGNEATAPTSTADGSPAQTAAVTATSTETAVSTEQAAGSTADQAAPVAAPAIVPAPPVAIVPAPPVVEAAPAPFTCAVAFCYPRVGIAGGIAPYSDCTGHTDIGTQIVQLNCATPTYLMGHAYTQFGRIVNWQAGDEVWVYGTRYTVYGAVITHCGAWPPPAGVLRMQTSLSSGCGDVMVVLAH